MEETTTTNRFSTMAETYDKMAPYMVPQYDFMQNEVFNIIKFPLNSEIVVVDLGAGSGIFLEKVLKIYPKAICYWIDFSLDFLRIAQNRLEQFGERVIFIHSPLEKAWEEQLSHKPDLIFSMSAIHHLENAEKINLYQKCFSLLNKSGWFFNADEMKTIHKQPYKNSLMYWADFVNSSEEKLPESLKPYYKKWNSHFDNWKTRNIENFSLPKYKGDDLHENFLDQLNWLSQAGFQNQDVFYKYHLWTMIGGQKGE
jgi:ubiquinone/menaquinone biosynthesis C-methylase UbiE